MNGAVLTAVLLVAGLARADETLARCEKGVRHAANKDLSRAMLYLDGCDRADLPDDRGPAIRAMLRETKKNAERLSQLVISSDPAGVAVELDALPGETLITPVTVIVPAGTYTLRFTVGSVTRTQKAVIETFSRTSVILDAVAPPEKKPVNGVVSFDEDGEIEDTTGPPPDIKHPSLVDDKYLRKPGPRSGPDLDDPLALGAPRGARPWFGLRLGGGMYDDGATSAAWRPTLAATARFRLARRLFLAARLDYSRRGGDSSSSIDTAGINAGVGYALLATRALQVSAIGQLRAELHFTESRDAMDVNRAGAGVSAGVEVAFWRTPFSVGIRGEQGMTELVAGARDRALLLELGVDWR